MSWIVETGPLILIAGSTLLFVAAVFSGNEPAPVVQRNSCIRDCKTCEK